MQLAAILVSIAVAWPLAVVAWSLPERFFATAALRQAPPPSIAVSLVLPVAAAIWAVLTVPDLVLPGMLVLGWTLIALAIIDARTFVLPDVLTIPLIAIGIVHAALVEPAAAAAAEERLAAASGSAAAALAAFAFMAVVAWAFRAVRRIEGLGLGDAKLLAAAGAWVGLEALPTVLLLAAVGALAGTVIVHRVSRTAAPVLTAPLPFGPYLAGAAWIAALYGPLAFG